MSNTSWYQRIEEREFHGKPRGIWIITGWYEDEKTAYEIAETEWNRKQGESGISSEPIDDISSLMKLAEDDDFMWMPVDDYFHWNVMTPHWYLHTDGTWNKLICKIGKIRETPNSLMYGEYLSQEEAEAQLAKSRPPDRFDNYVEHLQNAAPPINI